MNNTLPDLMFEKRQHDNLKLNTAALQAGISPAAFGRIEAGGNTDLRTFWRLVRWCEADANDVLQRMFGEMSREA